jgi:hypothetical protein
MVVVGYETLSVSVARTQGLLARWPRLGWVKQGERRVQTIRIAGNTQIPALLVLRAKRYHVALTYAAPDMSPDYTAERDGCLFSADSPEALLGLVAMWEAMGSAWRALTDSERAWFDQLMEAATVHEEEE